MWSKFILITFSLLFTNTMMSQNTVHHFYIKVKGKHSKPEKYKLEFGEIVTNEKERIFYRKTNASSLDEIRNTLQESIDNKDNYDLNIYIHGMWANQKSVWKHTVKNLMYDLQNVSNKDQILFSIIWDTGVIYENSVSNAYTKGKYLSNFFYNLVENQTTSTKINVIAHSMGNRLFQGMTEHRLPSSGKFIWKYICMGADLEENIFEKNQPFEFLPNLCENIIIYVHNNDRTLKVSSILNKDKRLGLVGIKDSLLNKDIFNIVDVSLITDNESIGATFSNHRYYYSSPLVREDMMKELQGVNNPKRTLISKKNRYKIQPPSK